VGEGEGPGTQSLTPAQLNTTNKESLGATKMLNSICTLDKILRGEATATPTLLREDFKIPILSFCLLIDILGLLYGLCMGVFALTGGNHAKLQLVACMIKVPSLFLLTLFVTLPSLYVFNALMGSRLTFLPMMRLLISAVAVMLAVLSSIGPIVGFFSFTTTSYPFMIVLNIIVFAIAGFLGLGFLLQTLHRLSISQAIRAQNENPAQTPPLPASSAGPLDPTSDHVLSGHVRIVFRIWVIVFGLVGAQMAWVLRPFIGNPDLPFTWFRPTTSNFFQGAFAAIRALIS
jgi:hypothetical protein